MARGDVSLDALIDSRLSEVLDMITENDDVHRRWLCTLSYLEMQGAKKICAHLSHKESSLFLLQHAAEETRHAFFFKKLMSQISSHEETVPLLGRSLTKRYVHLLDLYIARTLRQKLGWTGEILHKGCYLYTTLVIELRAMKVYPLYEKFLVEKGFTFSLKVIFKEEENHLKKIQKELDKWLDSFNFLNGNDRPSLMENFLDFDALLFSKILQELNDELCREKKF